MPGMDKEATTSMRYTPLSYTEQLVLDAVVTQKARLDDIRSIANICKLTEAQMNVAVQLLTYKKMFPEPDSSKAQ